MFNSYLKNNSFIKTISLICWSGLILFVVKVVAIPLFDRDLWWQLTAGRTMTEKRLFLRNDIFSHSMTGVEWINFEWFSQILLYLIYKVGGLTGIYFGKIILCLVVLALLTFLLKSLGARGLGLWIALLVGFFVLRPRLFERIELASLILLPIFSYLLTQARNAPPQNQKKVPWLLMALMILWVNLHGGFIYGLGLVVLFNLGAHWSRETTAYAEMINLSVVLVLVGTLINPFGPRLYMVLFEHLKQLRSGPSLIYEWASPSVATMPVFWGLFLAAGALLVMSFIAKRPEARFWAAPVLVFSIWSSVSQRNTSLSAFVLLPFVVEVLSKWERFHRWRSSQFLRMGGWAFALLFLALQLPTLAKALPREKIHYDLLPEGACQFIKQNNVNGKMYNSYEFGGYIEWSLEGTVPVLMDGRYLFHSILAEHARINHLLLTDSSHPGWAAYFSKGGFDFAVTNYGDFTIPNRPQSVPFSLTPVNAMFPRSDWALVFWDDTALVFVRRAEKFQRIIEQNEYRWLWPYNLDQMKVLIETGTVSAAEVQRELVLHRNRVGSTYIGRQLEKIIGS